MSPSRIPQAVNHPTFSPPPFDHGLSVPGLYEYQAKHSPDHPAFVYAHPDHSDAHRVTFSDAWESIGAVAECVSQRCATPQDNASATARTVVGILAVSDALTYIYTLVALMSLGYTPFPMAPTNSAGAVAHLLEAKSATQLLVSADEDTQALARRAQKILSEKGIQLRLLPMVMPDDYVERSAASEPRNVARTASEEVALILHSSGSTGLPKPIPMTDKGLVSACNIPWFGEMDLAGKCLAAHTNPPSHATGIFALTWPLTCGVTCALYPPVQPLIVPTPANFLAAWQACKCDIVVCMPVFIEALARDPANLPALKALELVVYTGASMTKSIGDQLVKEGVRLLSLWGSTEVGAATKAFPRSPMPAADWEYFEFAPNVDFYMKPQQASDPAGRVFEPVKTSTETSYPNVTNTEVDGRPAWAMGDLLERHPEVPTRWKVLGRQDDQIVFSTGKMLNPVSIENMLAQDPNIGSAIVFGHGHLEPGLLVEPKRSNVDAEDFKDLIWPAVEKANTKIQEYQIRREMILVASPEKSFQHTPKGTTRRGVCLKMYQEEIDSLYAAESDTSLADREFRDRM